jgi:hypothetical protein
MALLWRIVVVFFALWLSTMAAGMVWSFGLLGAPGASDDPMGRVVFWGAAFIASGFTASLLFLPTLIAVVLAEAFKIRSLLIHACAGIALTLLAYQGIGFANSGEESIDRAPPPVSREFQVAVAAGAAFGLVYWLIAGRRAGAWRA